jgi:molecular chaperone DnaK (HSP70)
MGRIVGIDLGTTYSAVAIPEERTGEGFLLVRGCPGCSIILDRRSQRITPSVIAEDDTGKVLVGRAARARIGLSPEPIMFSKRWMGEDKVFRLNRLGTLTPEDVAVHILRYLKEMAEWRLGEPVDQAVITVPAYFTTTAIQLTRQAGQRAGLTVEQIAQEPVAAALMYCAGDDRDPLRIMTYDLGGGTFDVAIVEKRDGIISTDSIRAHDGDHLLGGYNFDKALALWLMEQLCEQGYDLRLDPDNPADRVPWAKLMDFAEQIKVRLSQAEFDEISVPNTGLVDRGGTPVSIQLEITREQFEDMIRDNIEETIRLCHRARLKAKPVIEARSFDEVLMVGGSSRIPLVGQRLEEEFGCKPRLVEPDLCVALGAAILAGTRARSIGCLKLEPIPTQTDLPSLKVTGRLLSTADLPDVAGVPVTLRVRGGRDWTKTTQPNGAFVFDVPLQPEATTEFVLTVASKSGKELARHSFSVQQTAAGGGGQTEIVTNVLAKPISIQLVSGLHVVAPERTPLPHTAALIQARTTDSSGKISVPILEDNAPLGEVLLENIPKDLPVGSTVQIALSIDANWDITGEARVPALNRKHPILIHLPKRRTPSRKELGERYDKLSIRARDARGSSGRTAIFEKAGIAREAQERLDDARRMLDDQREECNRINQCLDEVEALINQLAASWKPEPSREEFDELAGSADDLVKRLVRAKPDAAHNDYAGRLAAILREADEAYKAQNAAAWSGACRKIKRLCEEVQGQFRAPVDDGPQWDAATMQLMLRQALTRLGQQAREQGRYEALEREFKEAADSLARIDPKAGESAAMLQLNDWYLTRYEKLRERIEGPKRKCPGCGRVLEGNEVCPKCGGRVELAPGAGSPGS